MGRGTWRATVHSIIGSRTQVSDEAQRVSLINTHSWGDGDGKGGTGGTPRATVTPEHLYNSQ